MSDKNKIIDINRYRQEKMFFDEDFLDSLMDLSEDELDDFYDDLAFGDEDFDEDIEAQFSELYPVYRTLTNDDREKVKQFNQLDENAQVDYLSSKFSLALFCKQNGLYEKALAHFQELYQLDKEDRLGARYEIMACLVLLYRYQETQVFYEAVNGRADEGFLAPLFVASLLNDDIVSCRHYVSELLKCNTHFAVFLEEEGRFPLDEINAVPFFQTAPKGSLDGLYLAFSRVLPILLNCHQFIHSYLTHHYLMMELEETVMLWELDFITEKMREELSFYNIHCLQDFAEWTETEILEVPGLGKVKLNKLKEAGAIFKEE